MDELLKLELRLILLRHGRRRVVEALAALGEQSPEGVEADLRAAEKNKRQVKTRHVRSATELAAEFARGRPDSAEALQKLAARYENRAFLPQLRDVQRFLERAGMPRKKLRSRREAAKEVMILLCKLGTEELARMASAEPAKESDYALLAREIMGRSAAKTGPGNGT
jgi:hypothetical protein